LVIKNSLEINAKYKILAKKVILKYQCKELKNIIIEIENSLDRLSNRIEKTED
jgi:hypothetical protein